VAHLFDQRHEARVMAKAWGLELDAARRVQRAREERVDLVTDSAAFVLVLQASSHVGDESRLR
jgi:hypothetical protein